MEEGNLIMKEYSDKEISMFKYFGVDNLIGDKYIGAISIYKVCVEKAFCEDLKGPYVDSLRRCMNALNSFQCNRMTSEFDKLILD